MSVHIAMATKFWVNLKPEEKTITCFCCEVDVFAVMEDQLWIKNTFSKIFDWIV